MKTSEENGGSVPDNRSNSSSSNSSNFEFHRGNGPSKASQPRKVAGPRGKPTPSKWDDAQKWLVGFSGGGGGEEGHSKTKPRSSNAEDRRLLHSASQKGRFSCSSIDGLGEEGETKNIDFWKINQSMGESPIAMRAVCVRDMGTEMTPVASQGPSRAATPIGATTPALRSPISSRSSTPERSFPTEGYQASAVNLDTKNECLAFGKGERDNMTSPAAQSRIPDSLESRAMAWDEAERAKDMARYKREEVKIQAWENRERRKAEMEMKRMEVKADRLKARAQERLTNKLAAARRIAEEKRANAEAKLNERAARTAERADYIRRTGHLPSSFTFRLPSLCG